MKNLLEKQLKELAKFIKGHPPIPNGANDVQEAYEWVEAEPDDLRAFLSSKQTELLEEIRKEIGGMRKEIPKTDFLGRPVEGTIPEIVATQLTQGYNQALSDLLAKLDK